MKKITLFLFSFCVSFLLMAQVNEDFETASPSGWTFMQTENDDPGFIQTSTRANSGVYSFYHNDDNIVFESTAWMISPGHMVSAGDDLSFFYQHNYTDQGYGVESGVWVSTNSSDPIANPGDFTLLYDLLGNASEDFWKPMIIDLDSYIGQTIYVAFKYVGDNDDELYIDDFAMGQPVVAPECVSTPISPLDGATNVDPVGSINLSWSAPASGVSPTTYICYAGLTPAGNDLGVLYSGTQTSFSTTIGAYGTTIYWTVEAYNGAVSSSSCAVWSFSTTPGPANDDLCDSTPLTLNTASSGGAYTNVGASVQSNEGGGDCWYNDGNDEHLPSESVWFSFIAPASGEVVINTVYPDGTIEFGDTQLALYSLSGSCSNLNNLTELACDEDDDAGLNNDQVTGFEAYLEHTGLIGGETYYVQVDGWGPGIGTFDIGVFDRTTLSNPEIITNRLMRFYPNPVTDKLVIDTKETIKTIEIYNLLGSRIAQISENSVSKIVDMSNYQSGVYIVKVSTNNSNNASIFKVLKK